MYKDHKTSSVNSLQERCSVNTGQFRSKNLTLYQTFFVKIFKILKNISLDPAKKI